MSNSTHNLKLKGVDQTAGAFNSVAARAKATGASIRAALGGALAAAGAYLSVRTFVSATKELGKLSDVAQKTNTNIEDLTKAATALQILGVNTGVDTLARSLQFMEKNTGKSGMAGFYQTIDELRAIPDLAERSAQTIKIFGRSGMELMPIVNASNDAAKAIREVSAGLSGIPSKAAIAGDRAADAMTTITNEAKSIWLQFVGGVLDFFDAQLPGGIREAGNFTAAYMEYFAKLTKRYIKAVADDFWGFFKGIAEAGGWAIESLVRYMGKMAKVGGRIFVDMFKGTAENLWFGKDNDMSFAAMFARAGGNEANEELAARMRGAASMAGKFFADVATDDLEARFKQRLEDARKSAKAAEAGLGRGEIMSSKETAKENGTVFGVAAAKRITNELIMGGSNAANRLAVLGPQYQNEIKKIADGVAKIVQNTQKTAENTEEGGDNLAATDL